MMGVRQWTDVLSYSALAHGLFWMLAGVILGAMCALLAVVSRRLRSRVWPGVLGVAIVGAAFITSGLWLGSLEAGVPAVVGWTHLWSLAMAGHLLVSTIVGYAVVRGLARTRPARWARGLGRLAFWPALGVLAICFVIQWPERPRLMAHTTGWTTPFAGGSPRSDHRPNVILVVLDTQRVDRLGCYGYGLPTTPRLDAFAADARVFENCISPSVWTLPAHASMFTGLFPSEHGATENHRWLNDGFTTMAETLGLAGYETIAFTNNAWISGFSNTGQGFGRIVIPKLLHEVRGNSLYAFVDKALYPSAHVGKWLGALTAQDEGAKFTNQLVARWLVERDPKRPFFLFVNYMEPHKPYRPHLPHRAVFLKPDDVGMSYRYTWPAHRKIEFSLLRRDCYTPAELELLSNTYNGETRLLDDYVGELLEILARRVPLDDSLVIITADHGENLGDHHMLGHSWCVYDTLAHVPLIVRYPRRLERGRSQELVQLTDLLPTVMDAVCGSPTRTGSTFGRSLLPPPNGKARAPTTTTRSTNSPVPGLTGRLAVVELWVPGAGLDVAQRVDTRFDMTPWVGVFRAVRQGPWKYIRGPAGREELYHVGKDPGETRNLIATQRAVADHLAKVLRQWLTASKPYAGLHQRGKGPPTDEKTHRRLRDLGYL